MSATRKTKPDASGPREADFYPTPAWAVEAVADLVLDSRPKDMPVVNAAIYATRHSLDDLLAFSDAQGSLGHEIAEGVVYKSHLDPSVSFKVIANRFLLRCES